ncbi:unnamed protein product [Polarella glacialis]|uniref:Uncharacterized protein n=1 Tax=Polarella glacialis TaxID=89957 RepID=A0A813LCT6_POLGL|nr:unnamed protein product [Polarella glacialis]
MAAICMALKYLRTYFDFHLRYATLSGIEVWRVLCRNIFMRVRDGSMLRILGTSRRVPTDNQFTKLENDQERSRMLLLTKSVLNKEDQAGSDVISQLVFPHRIYGSCGAGCGAKITMDEWASMAVEQRHASGSHYQTSAGGDIWAYLCKAARSCEEAAVFPSARRTPWTNGLPWNAFRDEPSCFQLARTSKTRTGSMYCIAVKPPSMALIKAATMSRRLVGVSEAKGDLDSGTQVCDVRANHLFKMRLNMITDEDTIKNFSSHELSYRDVFVGNEKQWQWLLYWTKPSARLGSAPMMGCQARHGFPNVHGEAICEPLKIEVLQPIASARLVLHPNKDRTFFRAVSVPFEIHVRSFQDAASSARDYLEGHGLLKYVQALLHAIIQTRPKDPKDDR